MEDNFKPLECNDNDVVSFDNTTYKVGLLRQAMKQSFNKDLSSSLLYELKKNQAKLPDRFYEEEWFDEGMDCEILNLGSGEWKKGKAKVKFSVEFYAEPEEEQKINDPDSLDDLRKELNQDNS